MRWPLVHRVPGPGLEDDVKLDIWRLASVFVLVVVLIYDQMTARAFMNVLFESLA